MLQDQDHDCRISISRGLEDSDFEATSLAADPPELVSVHTCEPWNKTKIQNRCFSLDATGSLIDGQSVQGSSC